MTFITFFSFTTELKIGHIILNYFSLRADHSAYFLCNTHKQKKKNMRYLYADYYYYLKQCNLVIAFLIELLDPLSDPLNSNIITETLIFVPIRCQ